MKLLGLFRHAKTDVGDLSLRDFDRGLNDRGRQGAALIGEHINNYGITWDRLLASPAERVRCTLETAEINVPAQWEASAYLADKETVIGLLGKVEGNPSSILFAGHNPGLQQVVFELALNQPDKNLFTAVADKFPTASFAVLELAIDDWAHCTPGCGRLIHFVRPRDLDPDLGPELGSEHTR